MLFEDLFQAARTVEGQHPSSPSLLSIFGGVEDTFARYDVNERTIMSASAVCAAVLVLQGATAALPLNLFRRTEEGKEKDREDPRHWLMHSEPNGEQSAIEWRSQLIQHCVVHGDHVAEIERNGRGDPAALWPIHPDRVRVKRERGELRYEISQPTGSPVTLPASEVFHLRGPVSPDGLQGWGLLTLARQAAAITLALERHAGRYWGNFSRPPGYISMEQSFRGEDGRQALERLRQEWELLHGRDNEGRVAILEEGGEYKLLGVPQQEAEYMATRKFQVVEISRFTLLPPHFLMDLEKSSFSNISEQERATARRTYMQWWVRIEAEANRKLFRPEERRIFFFKHDARAVLRGSPLEVTTELSLQHQNGFINRNEAREELDRNSIGPEGDEYRVQLNLGPTNGTGTKNRDAASSLMRPLLRAALDRVVSWECAAVRREAQRKGGSLEGLADRVEARAHEELLPVLEAMALLSGQRASTVIESARRWAQAWRGYSERAYETESSELLELVGTWETKRAFELEQQIYEAPWGTP